MFSLVVRYLGFIKSIPLAAQLFDSYIKMCMLIKKPQMADWLDELEDQLLKIRNITSKLHKYGGTQFNYCSREIGHVHSNGILDVRLNRRLKTELLSEGKITDHHVFKNSGWITFYIHGEQDLAYALTLLNMAILLQVRYDKSLDLH